VGRRPDNLYLTVIIVIDKVKAGDYLGLIIDLADSNSVY
jgi:hypothetical protein